MRAVVAAVAVILLPSTAGAVGVGDKVCYEGFVMDTYCIERGTMLDNPSKDTLSFPELHTMHCLVDPPQCTPKGGATYELLAPDKAGSPNGVEHGRAYNLGHDGSAAMLDFARKRGSKATGCKTCEDRPGGVAKGFKAVVSGVVADAPPKAPPVLKDVKINDFGSPCPNGASAKTTPDELYYSSGGHLPWIRAHGSCMLLSWGLLLPGGVITARKLRHRHPAGWWFVIHQRVQRTGLLLALAGWVIALVKFDVFSGPATKSTIHGGLGMATMVLGILQPINAYFRPHPPEDKTPRRVAWERLHKGSGYLATFLGLVTALIGTTLAGKHAKAFQGGYAGALALLTLFALWAHVNAGKANAAAPAADAGHVEMGAGASNGGVPGVIADGGEKSS